MKNLFVPANSSDNANICKYFLVQSTDLIMHIVTLFSGFDERRFFLTSGCAFAVPYLSILFVTFSQLSRC